MSIKHSQTDSFGDKMVFVESYNGFLPNSENIPTKRPQNGVSGISHDGDIYCIDCAKDMNIITVDNGEMYALVDGKQTPFHKAPWTGIVTPHSDTMTQYHCACGSNCINAVDGDNHPYNHSSTVGIGIEEQILEH